jgi:hypothetical protein
MGIILFEFPCTSNFAKRMVAQHYFPNALTPFFSRFLKKKWRIQFGVSHKKLSCFDFDKSQYLGAFRVAYYESAMILRNSKWRI